MVALHGTNGAGPCSLRTSRSTAENNLAARLKREPLSARGDVDSLGTPGGRARLSRAPCAESEKPALSTCCN
eukprot:11173563-Lingulodinium_polyedra.AAC.1